MLGVEIGLLIGPHQEAVECLKKYSHEATEILEQAHDSFGACIVGHRPTYIWLSKVTPGNVVHEATHAAVETLHDRGVPINAANDEILAYTIEYIVKEIYRLK